MKDIENGNQGTVKGEKPVYNMGTIPLPTGIRTEIRNILQDVYFVLKNLKNLKKL